jgi:hypothetical protein
LREKYGSAAAALALGIFLGCANLLASGSPLLLVELPGVRGVPWGTLIAWMSIFSLPLAAFLGFHRVLNRGTLVARISRWLITFLVLLGASWGLVAYGLAGNWAFDFSNQAASFRGSVLAGEVFWAYSRSLVAVSILAAAFLLLLSLYLKFRDPQTEA